MSVINHPAHYADATHGITGECIDYTEHLGFTRGNAFKYVWRAGYKGDPSEDLSKALWYVGREIKNGAAHEARLDRLSRDLQNGPLTLRRTILIGLWKCEDLGRIARLIEVAIYDPDTLEEEI